MAGNWKSFSSANNFNADTMLLLTDGTVLCQEAATAHWWRLQPHPNGDYAEGAWTRVSDGPNAPMYYASAVLSDGTVFVAGGEYNNGAEADLCAAQLYDPTA